MSRIHRRRADPDAPPAPIDVEAKRREAMGQLRATLINAGVKLPARPTEQDILVAALVYAASHPDEAAAWAESLKGRRLMPRSGVTALA